jgi:type VI secretion system protein ImpL
MQYLKQFLAFLFSRQMLAFLAMVLLALAIWFVGPLLAMDGRRPLASVGVRVAFIVLLLVLGILWLVSGPYSLVGVAALCLLLWHAGPVLAIGATKPLAPVWVRMAIIGIVLFAYALYGLYRLWQALRNNDDLLARFLSFGREAGKDETGREEIKTITATVHRALAQFKGLRGRGGLRRLFEGTRYLYELPWCMIVGSAGAGKTTALLNAGLQFPLARQMGNASKSMVLKSGGGTLHCDWWFSNEAVLIDTAGRYTTQESDPVPDPVEWRGFLGLLRRHRTRAPLNGVIVALNAAELLTMAEWRALMSASASRLVDKSPVAANRPERPTPVPTPAPASLSARPPELMGTPRPQPAPVCAPQEPERELSDEEIDALPPDLPAPTRLQGKKLPAPRKPVLRNI